MAKAMVSKLERPDLRCWNRLKAAYGQGIRIQQEHSIIKIKVRRRMRLRWKDGDNVQNINDVLPNSWL